MSSAGDAARISTAAQSDVGRSRTENQDAFGEFRTNAGERLFVVADGMGGHRGGATASRLCVETVGRVFTSEPGPAEARLAAAFEQANTRVREAAAADSELRGMGTTVVALALDPSGRATLGWVGDSRAYVFRDGSLDLLTSDHSVVAEMVRAGTLAPEDAELHPRRNELMRAIGPRAELEPETKAFATLPGDRFLLCSDGLWGPVPEPEIAVTLGFELPELAVRKLVAKANERGGPDNVTVMIVRLADAPLEAALAPPPQAIIEPPSARPRALVALLGSAAAVAAALIVLAVVALRDQRREELQLIDEPALAAAVAPAPEPTAAPAPPVAAAAAKPEPPRAAAMQSDAAKLDAAKRAAAQKAAAAEAEAAQAAAAKAEAAKAEAAKRAAAKTEAARAEAARTDAARTEAARAEAAKVEAARTEAARAQAAKVEAARAEAARAQAAKAAAAAPEAGPEAAPAEAAALETPRPEAAPLAAEAPPDPPADVAAAPPASEPVPASEAAAPPAQAQVEKFLGDWEAAIQSKDFALYSSLGLPDDAQEFQTRYVDKDARLDFSLRDVQRADADRLLLRVQMVFETRDRTGVNRVEKERRFFLQETSNGLRYAGTPKN